MGEFCPVSGGRPSEFGPGVAKADFSGETEILIRFSPRALSLLNSALIVQFVRIS